MFLDPATIFELISPRLPWPVGKLFLALLYILQQMLKVPGTALASGLQRVELCPQPKNWALLLEAV